MQVILNADDVALAATKAIDDMGEFDDYEIVRLGLKHEHLDDSISNCDNAFCYSVRLHRMDNPYFKNFWFNKEYKTPEQIVKELLHKEYADLFNSRQSSETYINYKFTKYHSDINNYRMKLANDYDALNETDGVILNKLNRELKKHDADKATLLILAKSCGQVILSQEEFQLIREWL